MTGPDGNPRVVQLNQVAQVVEAHSPSQINRRALTREVQFTANVALRSVGEVSADITRVLQQMQLPPGYRAAPPVPLVAVQAPAPRPAPATAAPAPAAAAPAAPPPVTGPTPDNPAGIRF